MKGIFPRLKAHTRLPKTHHIVLLFIEVHFESKRVIWTTAKAIITWLTNPWIFD
jgi:hypothetical protein